MKIISTAERRLNLASKLFRKANSLCELGRWKKAYRLTVESINIWRSLAREESKDPIFEGCLANALAMQASIHSEQGMLARCLEVGEEALAIRRRLAEQDPRAYLPDLATSLNHIGVSLRDLGHVEEALKAHREALMIRRRLDKKNPNTYLPDVATSLSNLGISLRDLGQRDEAFRVHREALTIRQHLAKQNADAYLPDVATSLSNLGVSLRDLGQRDEALKVNREALAIRQRLDKENPKAFQPNVATSLNNLAVSLRDLGHWEEALKIDREALAIRRRLAEQNSKAHLPDVAMSLNGMGNSLRYLGHRQEALRAHREALAIRRRLARQNPKAYMRDVALSLSNVGVCLRDLGHRKQTLKVNREALEIRRRLANQNPKAYEPDVATSLSNLGVSLGDLGHKEEALKIDREALAIRRRLAGQNSKAYLPDVGMSLSNLGPSLRDLGHWEEALSVNREALAIHRRLANKNPEAFLPNVATSLSNLGVNLRDLGHWEEALSVNREALTIQRCLANKNPEAFLPNVATSLSNLGVSLRDLGHWEEALTSDREALEIRYFLAEQNPETYLPEVATSLSNLGDSLRRLGDVKGALSMERKALPKWRRLAKQNPDAYLPDVATSLSNLGVCLRDLGNREEALTSDREALAIRQRLAKQNPRAYLPDVATSLSNLGASLRDLGDREEALRVNREALAIFLRLAKKNPNAVAENVIRSLWINAFLEVETNRRQIARRLLTSASSWIIRFQHCFTNPAHREHAFSAFSGCLLLRTRLAVEDWCENRRSKDLNEALASAEAARSRKLLELVGNREALPEVSRTMQKAWSLKFRAMSDAQIQLDALEKMGRISNREVRTIEFSSRLGGNRNSAWNSLTPVQANNFNWIKRQKIEVGRKTLAQAEKALQQELRKVRHYDPDFNPHQPIPPISVQQQLKMFAGAQANTWCLTFLISDEKILAFVLAPGLNSIAITLPLLSRVTMIKLLNSDQWFKSIQRHTVFSTERENNLGMGPTAPWSCLEREVLEPVVKLIPKTVWQNLPEHLIIIPDGWLGTVPIHTLPLPHELGGGCLADRFTVSYAPSLSLAERLVRKAGKRRHTVLAVVNPHDELKAKNFLGGGALEGITVQERYPRATILMGKESTTEGFLRAALKGPGICHVSAHMATVPNDPLKSYIILADGRLELRDIYARMRMSGTWLTILNGCRSGVVGKDTSAGNPEGLSLGFLFAGSTTVLSTLWPVDDLPSAMLMDRFHFELQGKVSVSRALTRAVDWLRGHETTPNSNALINGIQAANAIRTIMTRVRNCRDRPRLAKTWREILSYCEEEAAQCEARFPDRPPFAHPIYWAGYVAIGAAWLKPNQKQGKGASRKAA
jgi:tetratricopeptide (TPR) repeat protein/CHAT domain-containing protein